MKRIWVRLTLAFALVIAVTIGTVSLLSALTAGRELRMYLTSSGMLSQRSLASALAEYYDVVQSWEGVDLALDQAVQTLVVRRGMMSGGGPGAQPGAMSIVSPGVDVLLADADGQIIYDSTGERVGRRLSRDEQSAGEEVISGDQVVGRVVVTVPVGNSLLGPLEETFLRRLQRFLVIGAVVAAGLGLLLGLALSRSLSAPLRRLATAARAVAGRDFSQRVPPAGGTELDEVANAFNDMAAALAQSERQRQNLVADVAHELRTPLSVLQGNLSAILDDVYPLDKAEISHLYDETRLLSRLVDDLRELALAEAGQLHLSLQSTDPAMVADNTVEHLEPAADAQGVALSMTTAPDMPPVRADPDRLAQVLRNLVLNALRHTPEGGSVAIRLDWAVDNGYVELAVADTGEGIAPDDLLHVFDRFWRADRSRSRNERSPGGSGLGLSIAKSLVEAHGGRIWAESTPGQGSIFHFTLPVYS